MSKPSSSGKKIETQITLNETMDLLKGNFVKMTEDMNTLADEMVKSDTFKQITTKVAELGANLQQKAESSVKVMEAGGADEEALKALKEGLITMKDDLIKLSEQMKSSEAYNKLNSTSGEIAANLHANFQILSDVMQKTVNEMNELFKKKGTNSTLTDEDLEKLTKSMVKMADDFKKLNSQMKEAKLI